MQSLILSPLRIAALALFLPATAMADGGTLVKLDGPATVTSRTGAARPAEVGARLVSGNTLTTARYSKAQVRFDDDSLFAVVQDSQFKVEEFRRRRSEPGTGIFSLIRGGFRTITGLIGKAKGDTYEVRTGVATIGVRGSSYAAIKCEGQCGKYKDGLYVKAEQGIIFVANPAGSLDIRAGQTAYVASEASAPILVKASPFDDPTIAAEFTIDIEFEAGVDPPRIEPEPSASPSIP